MYELQNEDDYIELVRNDWTTLGFINDQTVEICSAAIHRNPEALSLVKKQTPELCLLAVQLDGEALFHVHNQTPEICLAAVKSKSSALRFVKDPSIDLCVEAVLRDDNAIVYVKTELLQEVMRRLRVTQLSSEYRELFYREVSSMFPNITDYESIRNELSDSYFGDGTVTDPWERAYRMLKGE